MVTHFTFYIYMYRGKFYTYICNHVCFSCAEPNLYCVCYCEGHKVTTPVCKNTLTPQWNTGAVFYRRKPNAPIKVQVIQVKVKLLSWQTFLIYAIFSTNIFTVGRVEWKIQYLIWIFNYCKRHPFSTRCVHFLNRKWLSNIAYWMWSMSLGQSVVCHVSKLRQKAAEEISI